MAVYEFSGRPSRGMKKNHRLSFAFCCSSSEVMARSISLAPEKASSEPIHSNPWKKTPKNLHFPDILPFFKMSISSGKSSGSRNQISSYDTHPMPPIVNILNVPSTKVKRNTSSEIWCRSHRTKSNWDDFFAGELSELGTNYESGSEGIDWEMSDSPSGIIVPDFHRSTISEVPSEAKEKNGQVFLLYLSKKGKRSDWVSLETRLEKVAAWLNEGSSYRLPISEPVSTGQQKFRKNFRKLTIKEAFEGRLTEKEGINFFIGPVDGKMSFKMTVCDLRMLMSTNDSMIFMEKGNESKENESDVEVVRRKSSI